VPNSGDTPHIILVLADEHLEFVDVGVQHRRGW
jgi:hypothetical protein